jgi:hypothetical protein
MICRPCATTRASARRLEAAIPAWRQANANLAKLLAPGLARRLAADTEALIRHKLARTEGRTHVT